MADYSKAEKRLHKWYLSNYFISRATLEMEEILFGKKATANTISDYVFVTGLARAGTTALMNKLFATGEYASLQYSNMPILLSPNLWKKELKIGSHERAHQDGIIIDGNSPEEFDEYFWKAYLKDQYIKEDGLVPHEIEKAILDKYLTYIRLVCYSKGKQKYISKNNNNILRLSALNKIKGSTIIVLFRDPLAHASSLLKLHEKFSKSQEDDPFELEYFNFLGHHEFGKGHKPFLLTETFTHLRKLYPKDQLNYWLCIWINYYEYLIEQPVNFQLICFEDFITDEGRVLMHLSKELSIPAIPASSKKFNPPKYSDSQCDASILTKARDLYETLKTRISY